MLRGATLGFALLFSLGSLTGCPGTPDAPTNATDLAGIDTGALTPRERKEFTTYTGELLAPCADVAVPVGQCLAEKRPCARCLPAARFVYKRVREGMSPAQIATEYKKRFDPAEAKSIDVAGSPSKGPPDAPVTIVEFADFECPGCKHFAPILDKVQERHKNDVRLVYKFTPLPRHPHGEPASRAAIAAQMQGKFWEMHHVLFERQSKLEQSDLESYAKELGLDVPRFIQDMKSQAATDRLSQDDRLAELLGTSGTPFIFVNGRVFDFVKGDLEEWVESELGLGK